MLDKAKSFLGIKKSPPDTTKPDHSPSILDRFRSPGDKPKNPIPKPGEPKPNGPANPIRPAPNQPAERAPKNIPGAVGGIRPVAPPLRESSTSNGTKVLTAPDGSVRELHSPQNNMSIHYGMNGNRQIRVDQPDGSRVMLATHGVPYIQKPWNFGSHAFDHRTYLDNGVLTHQFYRPYQFGGTTLDTYAPQRFYSQDFYKWVAKPQLWTPPRPWSSQDPWFTHYQTYFTPQPSYASPLYWLTDFVLAMSLFEAYNAHPLPAQAPPAVKGIPTPQSSSPQAPSVTPPVLQPPPAPIPEHPVPGVGTPAPDDQGPSLTLWQRFTNFIRSLLGQTPADTAPSSPGTAPSSPEPSVAEGAAPITDDVKNKVADEVAKQIDEEARESGGNARNQEPKAGAGGIVEELARPAQHVFVVASDLDLVDDSGRRCMISEGDAVQILSAADPGSGTAQGVVLSSKGGQECAQSAKVDIGVADLQEMQNHMRAIIDQGLATTDRGKTEPTVTPAFAAAAPQADPDAKSEIEKQKAIAASLEGR
jgi:hypothetical protein